MVAGTRLPIDRNAGAIEMAETIFGDGVTVVNASYTGDRDSSGIYRDGDAVSPGVTPSDEGVILSTGEVRNFTNNNGDANQSGSTTSNTSGPNGDPDFNAAAGTFTYDAAYLEADFIPTGDTLTMQFVFASEEYPEFTNSVFQDMVGVWSNGQQVDVSFGDGDTDPGNVNDTDNSNLFIDNSGSQFNTEMDGFTTTMTLNIPVNPGQVNSLKIGIADVADSSWDSNLLIAADSAQTTLVAGDDSANLFPTGTRTIDVLDNDQNATGGTLTVTHLNGQAVTAGDVVTLGTGQDITLNPDGTIDIAGDGDVEQVTFTYGMASSTGQSDTGIVTVDQVPCFVAGTRIRTPDGHVPIEDLAPGDMVITCDEGPQPLRWIGRRRVIARGDFAPIRIAPGAFGTHGELHVSPLHRVLIREARAELLFGTREVLAAARDLVNGGTVRPVEGRTVEYLHILFDRHQIVISEGLETESFLPGPQSARSLEARMLAEVLELFPGLDPETGRGYGPAARRTLKRYEAQLLMGAEREAA